MVIADRVSLDSVEEWDTEVLAEISKRAFETDADYETPAPGGGPMGYDSPEFYARILGYLECYKILLDDRVVGGIMVSSRGTEHRVLERIFVDPDHMRQGVGSRAMELTWEKYPEVKLWTLGTPEWNTRTSNFYEKLGFVQIGWDLAEPEFRGRWYKKAMDPDDPYEMANIGDLKEGMGDVDVEGEILEKGYARAVRSRRRGEELSVANAGLGDDTGRVVIVLWNQQIRRVKLGDRIRIEHGYVNSYRGITQLNVGRAGKLIHLL